MCVEKQDKIRHHTCNGHTYLVPTGDHGDSIFTLSMRPLTPQEIRQEDSPVRALFSKIESLLLMLYEIAYGEDIKTFLSTLLGATSTSLQFCIYVRKCQNDRTTFHLILSLLFLKLFQYTRLSGLVCAMTIPVLYLQFQEVIDNFIREVSEEKNKLLEVLKSNVLNKIPRATKEE
ncbi:hypothetical protein YC2023_019193 [Brassica napus]